LKEEDCQWLGNLAQLKSFKGTVSRDFWLQAFFINHLPPSPWDHFNFTEIFSSQGAPLVSGTDINDTGGKF
jgi:hypothetical protein